MSVIILTRNQARTIQSSCGGDASVHQEIVATPTGLGGISTGGLCQPAPRKLNLPSDFGAMRA
jgi:hypothetical protein